ncbi:MAG: flagellar basal body P-ring formation chaperone FlgA [Acidobacteriota bacterium]|nr:flagellar basal body P-ring formation chaperone FlgA [Acidobacteriota bacterium]
MILALAVVSAACLAVSGPNITALEIAKAVPSFTPADPDSAVGYAPAPGVDRIMHPGELKQILTRLNFDGPVPLKDVCFERPVAVLSAAAVMEAMHRTLGEAHIEVLEISLFPAPSGELVFPRQYLGAPPEAVWRGYVLYDGEKKFPIWTRVKVSVNTRRVIALEELKPGVPIKASQIAMEKVEEFPERRVTPSSIDQVEGSLPRRFISANSPIWTDAIEPPNDIAKGDRITVVVTSGLAKLSFDAEAQNSGRLGDFVSFKNPDSGRLFRARVEGPGKAGVETPSVKP